MAINKERNLQILAFYLENHTLEECGQKFEMTGERVRQIVRQAGCKPRARISIIKETLTKNRARRLSLTERFWSNVQIRGEDECWEWIGNIGQGGYGRMYSRLLGLEFSHRLSYFINYRKKAKNYVLHSCDNPPCVNPKHLRDGTPAENMRDRQERRYDFWYSRMMEARGNGESLKYSQSEVEAMLQMRSTGASFAAIGKSFGTCHAFVRQILGGQILGYQKFLQ